MIVGGHGGIKDDGLEYDGNGSNSNSGDDKFRYNFSAFYDKEGNVHMDVNVSGVDGIGFPFDVKEVTNFIITEYGDYFGALADDPQFKVGLMTGVCDAFNNEYREKSRSTVTGNRTDFTMQVGDQTFNFGFF